MAASDPSATADKFDELVRKGMRLITLMIPAFVLAVSDLATGWAGLRWRIDVGILAALAGQLYGLLALRRTARRIRSGELRGRATRGQWARSIASMLGVFVCAGGLGYLIGGWTLALLLPVVTIVLAIVGILLGVRRRRQLA